MKIQVVSIIFFSFFSFGVLKAEESSHGQTLDLSRARRTEKRPVDSSSNLTGIIVLKPYGKNKEWPYLKANSKEYRLETTDPQNADQIAQCEPGDVCTIRGDIVDGADPVLKAKSLKIESYAEQQLAENGEEGVVTTINGCKFKRDNFNPALGETWKSPKGVVWGELELNADGSPALLGIEKAFNLCAAKGGRLPTKEEWKELAACFDGFEANTAPLRKLNVKTHWALDSNDLIQAYRFNPAGWSTPDKKFRPIERLALDPEGFTFNENERSFIRCVSAH
jgi:hypothetical protein